MMIRSSLLRPLDVACLLLAMSVLLLAACNEKPEPTPTLEPIVELAAAGEPVFAPGEPPTPLSTAVTPTALPPTPRPTATPLREVRLSVPEYLEQQVLVAIQAMESAGTQWRWQLVGTTEQADVILEPGDRGEPAGFRTLALTVPFTMNWEEVAVDEARAIISAGHDAIMVVDWATMPPDRKALRVDGLLPHEEAYPLRQGWSLVAAGGFELAALELSAPLRETLPEDKLIRLTAVGDLMLDRAIGYALANGDLSFPFAAVAETLAAADIAVGNLESSLGDLGQPASKSYTFQAPPEAAEALALVGFDLLSLANNHALDYGPEALMQGMQLLGKQGIATVGAGPDSAAARAPYSHTQGDVSVAFLSYVDVPIEVSGFDTRSWSATEHSPGLAWADEADIKADVAAAGQEHDLVVVLLHSGYEYVQAPSPEQMRAARTAVDAGADLVIGHHAHVLQGIEIRDDSVIVYGLGNFAFEIDGDPTTMIANIWLDADGVRQVDLLPAVIEAGGRPRPATVWEATDIRQQVYRLSNLLIAER